MALKGRRQRFVEEYLVDLNATAAYKRAGYKGTGRTAENNASRLLGYAGVQEAIRAARETQAGRVEITQDEVLNGLRTEAKREGVGSSHSARVTAWKALGEHLGLFGEEAVRKILDEVKKEVRELREQAATTSRGGTAQDGPAGDPAAVLPQ